MNKYIENIIDSIIRKNSENINGNYYCELQSLSECEIRNLSLTLFNHDEGFKDIVKDYIHDLIEQRLGFVQAEDNYHSGLVPSCNDVNGEITWNRRAI